MSIIEKMRDNVKSISIVGLAKNAGKTVALNYLIEKASHENLTIGLTSTGRDGENTDLVTNTEKPTIFAEEGILVATARQALLLSDAKVEILEVTDFMTPMGEVVIAKVKCCGNIQIAGPSSVKEIKKVSDILLKYGAQLVFVDGAIDRRASSSPVITDACILATGAVLSRDIKKAVEKTLFAVECYRLKETEKHIVKMIKQLNSTCIISSTGDVLKIDASSGITAGKKITEKLNKDIVYVYVKGAITTLLLKELCQAQFVGNYKLIIDDATKIFTDSLHWNEAKKKGIVIETVSAINLIGLTVNPISPEGYCFDSMEFVDKLNCCIKDLDIIDVVLGGE